MRRLERTAKERHSQHEDQLFLRVSRPVEIIPRIPKETELAFDDYIGDSASIARRRAGKRASDPEAKNLHKEARKLYDRANKAYKEGGGSKQYIPINSGMRTAAKQLEFFMRFVDSEYYGGDEWPPTNRPGQSMHEYGLAIDIDLKGDKKKIVKALISVSFRQTKDHEPWHFEATKVAAYKESLGVMKGLKGKSEELAVEVGRWFEFRKKAKAVSKEYREEKERLGPEERRLREEKRQLRELSRGLSSTIDRLDEDARSIESGSRENDELRRRIDNMVYSDCPEGFPYSECGHNDRKNRYDRKVRKLEERWASQEQSLDRRTAVHRTASNRYRENKREYQRRLLQYRRDEQDFRRESEALRELKRRFSKTRNDMNKSTSKQRKITKTIQKSIDELK